MVIVVDRILIWPPGGLLLVYMSYMVPSPEIPHVNSKISVSFSTNRTCPREKIFTVQCVQMKTDISYGSTLAWASTV